MNRNILIATVIVVVIAIGNYFFIFQNDDPDAPPRSTDQSTQATATIDTNTVYTAYEVALHAAADDCWTIIDDNVYDITPYVPNHPGGDEILRACGQDGSTLFNQRETADGQSVGTGLPHSSNAQSILGDFQIGVVN